MALPHLTIWNWLAQASMDSSPAMSIYSKRAGKKVGNMTSSFYELPGSLVSMLSNYSGSQTGRCTWMLTPHLPQMCRMRRCESIQSATLSKNHWVSPHPGTLGPMRRGDLSILFSAVPPFQNLEQCLAERSCSVHIY